MKLYMVEGRIRITRYMVDKPEFRQETRLVQAKDAAEAEEKFEKFWDDKTEDYCIYYTVLNVTVTETIS